MAKTSAHFTSGPLQRRGRYFATLGSAFINLPPDLKFLSTAPGEGGNGWDGQKIASQLVQKLDFNNSIYIDVIKIFLQMHEYHGPMKWKIDQLFQKDKESCGENFQND